MRPVKSCLLRRPRCHLSFRLCARNWAILIHLSPSQTASSTLISVEYHHPLSILKTFCTAAVFDDAFLALLSRSELGDYPLSAVNISSNVTTLLIWRSCPPTAAWGTRHAQEAMDPLSMAYAPPFIFGETVCLNSVNVVYPILSLHLKHLPVSFMVSSEHLRISHQHNNFRLSSVVLQGALFELLVHVFSLCP